MGLLNKKILQEIEDYIDNEFGSWNYFGIRGFVKSAMNNTLKQTHPQSPYSAYEILAWAEWNDSESFLFTAGRQAMSGQETTQNIFGSPEINPITNQRNSQRDIDGMLVSFAKSGATPLMKIGLALGAVVLILEFAKAKAKKLGGA